MVEGHARDDQAGDGIDQAEEDDVGPAGGKILEALRQRIADVGGTDPAHAGRCDVVVLPGAFHGVGRSLDGVAGLLEVIPSPFQGITNVVLHGHDCLLLNESFEGREPVESATSPRSTTRLSLRLLQEGRYWMNLRYWATKSQPTSLE